MNETDLRIHQLEQELAQKHLQIEELERIQHAVEELWLGVMGKIKETLEQNGYNILFPEDIVKIIGDVVAHRNAARVDARTLANSIRMMELRGLIQIASDFRVLINEYIYMEQRK